MIGKRTSKTAITRALLRQTLAVTPQRAGNLPGVQFLLAKWVQFRTSLDTSTMQNSLAACR
jgi:hypothetical protein